MMTDGTILDEFDEFERKPGRVSHGLRRVLRPKWKCQLDSYRRVAARKAKAPSKRYLRSCRIEFPTTDTRREGRAINIAGEAIKHIRDVCDDLRDLGYPEKIEAIKTACTEPWD